MVWKRNKLGKSFSFFRRKKSDRRIIGSEEKSSSSPSLLKTAQIPPIILSDFKLMKLPRDVFKLILQLLPTEDLFKLSRVSKYWSDCRTFFM
jgi:hypothetical protein